jgi:hypothetical protein
MIKLFLNIIFDLIPSLKDCSNLTKKKTLGILDQSSYDTFILTTFLKSPSVNNFPPRRRLGLFFLEGNSPKLHPSQSKLLGPSWHCHFTLTNPQERYCFYFFLEPKLLLRFTIVLFRHQEKPQKKTS